MTLWRWQSHHCDDRTLQPATMELVLLLHPPPHPPPPLSTPQTRLPSHPHHHAPSRIISTLSSHHPDLLPFLLSRHQNRHHLPLWNSLLKSLSRGRHPTHALLLFALMLHSGVPPDAFTFSFVLTACSNSASFHEALQVQGLVLKRLCGGAGSALFIWNSLICLYSRCGRVELARQLFDKMLDKDTVSWNTMIDGYAKQGMVESAQLLFDRMRPKDRNLITWNSLISGYVQFDGGLERARALFDEMPDRDLVSWNTLVDGYVKHGSLDNALALLSEVEEWDVITWANLVKGYAKMGHLETARALFDKMPERDVVAWNVMISGYVQNGNCSEAVRLFSKMRAEEELYPDDASIMTVLSAIAELGRIDEGVAVHGYMEKNGICIQGKLGVALIDMYSKCGDVDKAMFVFKSLRHKIVDHWNAMIGGLAIHGLGAKALQLFAEMERLFVKPDDITFIGILTACSHAGLVEKGLLCFELMQRAYNIKPKVQHFGCVVDILGRAGMLDLARRVIEMMPIPPNDVVWRALLSACKIHDNLEIGQVAATHVIELDSCCSSSYGLLSNFYAGAGRWEDVSKIRSIMKENQVKRIPGCSRIKVDGSIHEFIVGDQAHLQAKEIYLLLDMMTI